MLVGRNPDKGIRCGCWCLRELTHPHACYSGGFLGIQQPVRSSPIQKTTQKLKANAACEISVFNPCPPVLRYSEFVCRSLQAIQQAVPGAKISFLECDLECFASIKRFVHRFREEHEQLTVLLNNAGVFMPPGGKTTQGFEVSARC